VFKFWWGDELYLTEGFHGLAESLHANARVEPQVRAQPLLPSSFLFQTSLIILPFDAIWSVTFLQIVKVLNVYFSVCGYFQ
jgi:hypothetical protein